MRTTMATSDPKQAIIDFLSQPEGIVVSQPDPNTPPVLKNGRWVRQGTVQRGGGMGARVSTITFLKERRIPHRQVPAVAFEVEDTVDDAGLVLFVTDQKMRVPVQVELYARSGDLVGQH